MQILQLVEDSSLSKPCVKLKLSMSDDHSKKVLAYIGWSAVCVSKRDFHVLRIVLYTLWVSLMPRPHLEWGLKMTLTEDVYCYSMNTVSSYSA